MFLFPAVFRYQLVWILLWVCTAAAEAQVPEQLPVVQVRATVVRTWPDSARRAVRDSLAVARKRWAQARPERYDFAVRNGPSMIAMESDRRHDGHRRIMRIKGDSIVAIVFESAPQYTRRTQWSDLTVERVFQHLEAAVDDTSRKVARLEIDPVFGYPRVWSTDAARNGYGYYASDQSDGGEVELFRPDTRHLTCQWWRQLFGRCK